MLVNYSLQASPALFRKLGVIYNELIKEPVKGSGNYTVDLSVSWLI